MKVLVDIIFLSGCITVAMLLVPPRWSVGWWRGFVVILPAAVLLVDVSWWSGLAWYVGAVIVHRLWWRRSHSKV